MPSYYDHFVCPRCGQRYPITSGRWLCACGGIFELEPLPRLDPARIVSEERSLWRYTQALPLRPGSRPVSLGEGWTPLVPMGGEDSPLLKLEFTNPSGSYKDRGASVLVSKLAELGIHDMVEDSSGNAGAALAAYAARAGATAHIYVPAGNSSPKLRQIVAYGAEMVAVQGTRAEATAAAIAAAQHSYYASHAHNPLFVEGCKTMAYEIWEQLGRRAPETLITPVGQGSILLGLYKGFSDLLASGLISALPRLVGVQAAACAPLANAMRNGLEIPEAVVPGPTLAEGIQIAAPVRGRELVAALGADRGTCLSVSEDEIALAARDLAHAGFYSEATSAVTLAGYRQLGGASACGRTVLILSGSGLKTG
jgi:threonine synthase